MSASPNTATVAEEEWTVLGHPISLFVLFFAEFWERFSFYGMRALLVLYMADTVSGLSYSEDYAKSVYGAYGAMVYATPAIGGLLADRLLGYRKAILVGGALMALGHFAMAVENPYFFFGALALLILGNGFFKPNISSLVGKLYSEDDPRRDGAFTIFYMGINLGAFFAPLACGAVAVYFGHEGADGGVVRAYHYGFGLAGIGMVLGLITFMAFQKHLGPHGFPPLDDNGEPPAKALEWATYVGPFLILPVVMWLTWETQVAGYLLIVGGALIFGYLFIWSLTAEPVERNRMWVILILMFFSMLFWSFFEQAGSSLTLFAENNVDRTIGSFTIETSWFQAVNPMFIVLLAPVFAAVWTNLDKRNLDPSAPTKFGLGVVQLGLGFGLLWWGATHHTAGITPMTWLILGYLLHTTGELCLSPVGLSMVTKLSNPRMVGMVMGAWFLATAFSHYLAAMIAKLTGGGGHGGDGHEATDAAAAMAGYADVFQGITIVALVAGVVCLAMAPLLSKWMHMDRLGEDAGAGAH